MDNLTRLKILVELDCLLDTRIATVAKIDQKLATKVLLNDYHKRIEDKFDGIDGEVFKSLYKSRDMDTLKLSMITFFMPLLKHLCNLLHEESISRPYHSGPEIIVNSFPYQLSDDIANSYIAAIKHWIGPFTPVSMIYINPKDLRVSYCSDLALMVMYDPTVWFNENLEELIKKPIHDVSLYIPQIYHNKTQTDEEVKELINETMDPFLALEMIMKTVIDVSIIDSAMFSLFDPRVPMDFSSFNITSAPGPQTS